MQGLYCNECLKKKKKEGYAKMEYTFLCFYRENIEEEYKAFIEESAA